LAQDGLTPYEILQYYYGDDINIVFNAPTAPNLPSYRGLPLKLGSAGEDVRTLKRQLNRIGQNYPGLQPRLELTGFFDLPMEEAVRNFQRIFNLTVDGACVKAAANGATPMAAGASLTLARPLPAGVAEHVPAELRAGYVPLYALNVPVTKGVNWRNRVPYYLDATRSLPDGAERVAYYFEQVKKDGTGTNFVWVSFDAWTDDLAKFGVPANDSIGFGQKWVTNQDVFSNVDGVVNGTGMDGGFLEFWPHNYGGSNVNHIPYASDSTCDWGDGLTGGATTWHACMQVHNVTNRQTIFGISNFNGSNTSQPVGAGIGNNTQYRANRSATGRHMTVPRSGTRFITPRRNPITNPYGRPTSVKPRP
jgi:peptidoglycan hydrolase-like protein with peptidoglycan-binding domain